jgi:hypothetical protein
MEASLHILINYSHNRIAQVLPMVADHTIKVML